MAPTKDRPAGDDCSGIGNDPAVLVLLISGFVAVVAVFAAYVS